AAKRAQDGSMIGCGNFKGKVPYGFLLNVNQVVFSPKFPKYAKKSLTGAGKFCNFSNYGILGILRA
ncbi:MAG TPA: hypothetical protein VF398_07645, partial [bacterium]